MDARNVRILTQLDRTVIKLSMRPRQFVSIGFIVFPKVCGLLRFLGGDRVIDYEQSAINSIYHNRAGP
jgi:hypothetical protein